MRFPNKCCQCGFCCLSENCITAQQLFKVPKYGVVCPGLIVYEDHTSCILADIDPDCMGINQGCCIKARAYIAGIEYDFASLPIEAKHYAFRLACKKHNKED